MKNQNILLKEIINEIYENNYILEGEILNYTLKFFPQMIIQEEANYDEVNKDEKVNDALDILNYECKKNDKLMIKLNNLLDEKEKDIRVINIEEKMKEIQSKKIISVKEFTKIYGFSQDWQKNRRSRIKNRLPSIQVDDGGKITYNVNEVEIWFENNNIQL